ncbi:MAG: hypothetical protein IT565_00945 [Rhodospirillales bacterium]|nr:hypothetical protein [Rhodospirillales bacterium]
MSVVPAYAVAPGALVRPANGVDEPLFLKARRDSKDYVNDYLVSAQGAPEMALIFLDPEEPLAIVAERPRLREGPQEAASEAAQPGDLLRTELGLFLKVWDDKKSARHLAYVSLESGLIMPRRERGVVAIYRSWRMEI